MNIEKIKQACQQATNPPNRFSSWLGPSGGGVAEFPATDFLEIIEQREVLLKALEDIVCHERIDNRFRLDAAVKALDRALGK